MTAAFATSASAITSSFDFRGPGAGALNPAGPTLTFFDLESNTHDVEVSAWVSVKTYKQIFESLLHRSNRGLGARHDIDTSSQIDNFGGIDFLRSIWARPSGSRSARISVPRGRAAN